MVEPAVGRGWRSAVQAGGPLLAVALVLGLVATLAASAGAHAPRTGVRSVAAAAGVKKCHRFRVVRIKHGRRVHVRVKKCVHVRSKACKVTWSKRRRHGKVVIRKHNPVWVAKVRCLKTKKTGGGTGQGGGGTGPAVAGMFPLKVSGNGRFLETAGNQPFLMVGDTPWSLIGDLSESSAAQYYADREAHGFNAALSALVCAGYTGCNANGTTYDGVAPFTSGNGPGSYDLSKPNMAYFQRAHDDIARAAADGIEVLLDPIETGSWLTTLENNGVAKDKAYGAFVGNFFKDLPNIIWISGNDFQTYTSAADNSDALAVARGIHSTDPSALQTSELSFCSNGGNTCIGSTSLDDSSWSSLLGLNGAYTYSPTYADVLRAYNASPTLPVFMEEANYEQEQNNATDGGSLKNLRLQEYWTLLSGATGQLYGCHCTWATIANGFSNSTIDTPGVTQLDYATKLFQGREWQSLVPDQHHTFVTAGFGTFSSTGSIDGNNYVTAAVAPDGKLGMAYLPQGGTITVNMGDLTGSVTAQWYDPTSGTFKSISGSPFASSGSHRFTTPGSNSAAGSDWVLVLDG
jgi:Protein of unknown function (DUF4038)/Putative collagen-binding domain of a collagenase